ncbi:hypothetical protein Apau_0755 [Aminomonas paucivorans DSM 12260]|uniref:Uncharacterized protein n=1 Tax=Aminomonas paucivorans DSM 12260 TaxID=584708 RepID=E3CV26_9BACT|nr:hypothetical protein [Aminomonas paucivorans]EFQ23183.1 hypothetical protein Apau_0755 [Aminomonas paucivorans DSM 12260]
MHTRRGTVRGSWVVALGLLGCLWAGMVCAAMGTVRSLAFDGLVEDRLGTGENIQGDGKKDLAFSVTLEGAGAVVGAELKHLTTGMVWDTVPGNGRPTLGVLDESGGLLNQGNSRLPAVAFLLGTRLRLVVSELAGEAAKGGEYEVTVRFLDRSEAKGRVHAAPVTLTVSPTSTLTPTPAAGFSPSPSAASGAPRILEARVEGPSDRDLVGQGEALKGNGTPDWRVRVKLQGRGIITGIRFSNHRGPEGTWDTLKDNGRWLVVVTRPSTEILTRADGTLRVPFRDQTELVLFLEDNGSLSRPETRSQLTLTLEDGTLLTRDAAPAALPEGAPTLTEFKGPEASDFDLLGPGENRGGDFDRDRRFTVVVQGKGVLTGAKLRSLKGDGAWDTIPGNKIALLGVAREGKTEFLNRGDGSLRLPVSGTTPLSLYAGGDAAGTGPFRVSLVFEDGRVLEKETGTVAAPAKPAAAPKLAILGRPLSLKGDRVGGDELLRGNGKVDWGFSVRLDGKGTLKALLVRATTGGGVWDTVPGNRNGLVGVRKPGGAYLNASDGSVSVPVNGALVLQLWMEDNKSLSRKKGSVRVEALFEDGSKAVRDLRW